MRLQEHVLMHAEPERAVVHNDGRLVRCMSKRGKRARAPLVPGSTLSKIPIPRLSSFSPTWGALLSRVNAQYVALSLRRVRAPANPLSGSPAALMLAPLRTATQRQRDSGGRSSICFGHHVVSTQPHTGGVAALLRRRRRGA